MSTRKHTRPSLGSIPGGRTKAYPGLLGRRAGRRVLFPPEDCTRVYANATTDLEVDTPGVLTATANALEFSAAARAPRIPSLCPHFTRAGIEWRR